MGGVTDAPGGQGHTDSVLSAAFSPDGTKIVTASWDKTAKVWDASSLQAGSVSPPDLKLPLPQLSILSPARNSAVSDSSVTLHLQVNNSQSLALRFAASVSKNSTRIQGLTVTSSSRDLNLTVPIPSSLNLQDGERFTVTLEGFTPSGDKLAVKSLELTYQKAAAPVGPVLPIQKKLALVIGNQNYKVGFLNNTLNDPYPHGSPRRSYEKPYPACPDRPRQLKSAQCRSSRGSRSADRNVGVSERSG